VRLDIFTDDTFTIPFDKPDAPSCPVCDKPLVVEVDERYTDTGMPSETGFTVWCSSDEYFTDSPTHRDWDYGELLSAIEETRRWFEAAYERKRQWEICLWGISELPRLEDIGYVF